MKDEIIAYLLQNGFIQNGDRLIKNIHKAVGETIINGQHRVEYKDVEIQIDYIGECWDENENGERVPLTQWAFSVDKTSQTEFLIHSIEEFKKTFK